MPTIDPEYLRRNLMVCKAVGAKANAASALTRLRQQKRPPKWLVKALEGIEERVQPLSYELANYRALIPVHVQPCDSPNCYCMQQLPQTCSPND